MKKEVKARARLKQSSNTWELFLPDRPKIIADCLELFKQEGQSEFELEVIFKNKAEKKNPKKLGYFYAEILPKITMGLVDAGNWEVTEEIAYSYLCQRFLGQKINIVDGYEVKDIVTLSDVGDTEMQRFMDKCIKFGTIDLKVHIIDSELWKTQQSQF